jgi:hypothetical protein
MEFLKRIKSFILTKHFLKQFGLMLLAYLLVVGGTVFYLDSYTNHGQQIVVPNLVGKNIAEIGSQLENLDLNYEILDSIYDPKKPEYPVNAIFIKRK